MTLLVETPDSKLVRKEMGEIAPNDLLVFDGPNAFESTERLQRELEADIAAAGGLQAWRSRQEVAHAA